MNKNTDNYNSTNIIIFTKWNEPKSKHILNKVFLQATGGITQKILFTAVLQYFPSLDKSLSIDSKWL
jgi:hypothetical protein